MPLIEELPVSQTVKASHGWAYVPDTGPIAAQQPGTRDRKRVAASSARSAATSSAKREKATSQRLESLNKENYRDGVSIPIPASNRERAKGRKETSNVKRILGYQRNFAHYLADVESNNPGELHYRLPNAPTAMGPPRTPALARGESSQRKASIDTSASRKRSTARRSIAENTTRPTTPTDTPTRGTKRGRQNSQSQSVSNFGAEASPAGASVKNEDQDGASEVKDTAMTDAPSAPIDNAAPPHAQSAPGALNESNSQPSYPSEWDDDPLLTSHPSEVPPMPSDRIMQILISEPPLTYTAARATPLDEDKRPPPRRFCGICGYWGKVKCKKCEEWTCGLMECWRTHEGTCPMANVY